MPIGPLSFLPAALRTAYSAVRTSIKIARGAVQTGARLGTAAIGRTTAAIGRAIERTGTSIQARQLRRLTEAEDRLQATGEGILGRPRNEILDPDLIPEAITRQRRNFAWRVRTEYIDPRTGERVDRHVTVSTDRMLSQEQATAEAEDMLLTDYSIERERIIQSEVTMVTRVAPGRRL